MSRFYIAMAAYAVIALLAWQTLSNEKVRLVTLAILGMFALRTMLHRRSVEQQRDEPDSK